MTSFWAAVIPLGRLCAVSERRGQSHHADADTSIYTAMPSCSKKRSDPKSLEITHVKIPIYGERVIYRGYRDASYVSAEKH